MLLHKEAFAQRNLYLLTPLNTNTFKHRNCCTQKPLHWATFTYKRFCTRKLYTDTFTQRGFCTEQLSHSEAFTHGRLYTQHLLHRGTFTHRNFHSQTPLHTDFFTQLYPETFAERGRYAEQFLQMLLQTLWHTEAFTHKSFWNRHLYTEKPLQTLPVRTPGMILEGDARAAQCTLGRPTHTISGQGWAETNSSRI